MEPVVARSKSLDLPAIQVRGLQFGYPGGFSLELPELRVDPGESLALTGESGSGKTTLLHLIAGILATSQGEIEVAGLSITGLPEEERQDLRVLRLGLVFQEFELLDYLSVLDNVLLPYRLTPLLSLTGNVRDFARELLDDVGLSSKMQRLPSQLSQGERQRVAVCRALVTRPTVLLGDEPTANLDPVNRDHIIDRLLRYGREESAPVLVVTHDQELLARFDRTADIASLAAGAS